MRTLGIKIVNDAGDKQIARGNTTRVFALQQDDEGNVTEVDISNAVRAVDARIHMGEVVTAKLEVFVTGIETRAEVEQVILRHIKPRRLPFWKRWREVTTFGTRDGAAEFVR